MTYEIHPVANIFPNMADAEFKALKADIEQYWQREPIWLYEGKVIDGRHRLRACAELGVAPHAQSYDGVDAVAFVVSLNLRRRHLDESQRAMVAARLATLKHGGDRSKRPIGLLKRADAAELLNVGKHSVERARKVIDAGSQELVAAVESGKVSVSAAATLAAAPQEQQREIVAKGEKEIVQAAKEIRARRSEERRAKRVAPCR